jgi:hypothetical protein
MRIRQTDRTDRVATDHDRRPFLRRVALTVAAPLALAGALATGTVALAPAAAAASAECATAALVAVKTDSNLYRWTTADAYAHQFSASAQVGIGWGPIRLLASDATSGNLFAVDTSGNLRRYPFGGTSYTGGTIISTGWGSITALIPAGDGVIYARDSGGALRWYRWLSSGWSAGSGTAIGSGWNSFSKIFSGGNGVIYGVRSDTNELSWYRHRNPREPLGAWEGPRQVGAGWGSFAQIVSVGGGAIFATTSSGALMYYRHLGYQTGVATWESGSGLQVGSGWSSYNRLTAGPTACGRLDAPTNLRAFAGGNGIALRWSPPAGASPSSYTVYRNGVPIATVPATSAAAYVNTARYHDTTATPGTSYLYQVSMTTTAGLTTVAGYSVSATLPTSTTPVPTVTFDNPYPDVAAQVDLTREVLRTWYPKFADVLARPGYSPPSTFTVRIADIANPGETSGNVITLDIDFVRAWATNPNFPGLVMHEATHMLQQYPNAPGWVAEGMAVWATHNILNDGDTPFPPSGSSYTSGYDNAAYLIRSASTWYARPALPHDLNVVAHGRTYSDAFWSQQTGRTLATLWGTVTAPRAVP